MGNILGQIASLLTTPAGNFLYHVVLVFSVAAALQSAYTHWRSSEFPQVKRAMLGLGFLLAAQVVLIAASGAGLFGWIDVNAVLPVLDRAYAVFSIIWITWLWAFPEPSRPADAAAALLTIFLLAATGLALLLWAPRAATETYNQTFDDVIWQASSIILLLAGGVTLAVRRPNGFGNGIAQLALFLVGSILHLLVTEIGNYSGILRLAYLAGYPLLLALPQRFTAPLGTQPPRTAEDEEKRPAEGKRYTAEPKTIHALLALASESNAAKVSQAIARAIAQTMLADLCFLVYLTDDKSQLVIASGYDLIREESLEGGSLKRTDVPMLTNAIQRGKALRLPASSTSADVKGLSDILGLPNPGNMLSVPILTPEKESLGGVILLSPYSNRAWSAEDQAFLASIASSLVPIMQRSQKVTKLEQQGELAQQQDERDRQELSSAREQIAALEKRNDEQSQQIEAMSQQGAQDSSKAAELAALIIAHEQSQHTIEELQAELEAARNGDPARMQIEALQADLQAAQANSGEEAQKTIESLQAELQAIRSNGKTADTQVAQNLTMALTEVALLREQLAESNRKVVELEGTNTSERRKSEQAEVIASISQELRQPMSSIIGYTDLLLGESVGILGALQRKFVERIKASTERMGSLMNDMIQLNTLEVNLADLKPESMDLNLIIDNAMAYTSSQVREKNITLHLDLPKKVAPVNADREALQQILIHLLQNAGAATPVEGTIHLQVQTTNEDGKDFVLIRVTDSGGGIPEEELPRVFTRLYRAENVLIQGVGDTGVGLSIAKTLTEAQHGRIWVESEPGIGATFSVLLPMEEPAPKAATRDVKP
ncbi:MAG TPA: ATP-binding protein [Anaerolineales bacterium]|nr:ATP-binding protein [Anaerolineales bacterium]